MALIHELTDYSLSDIGRFLTRDHSTVRHGIDQVQERRRKSPDVDALFLALRERARTELYPCLVFKSRRHHPFDVKTVQFKTRQKGAARVQHIGGAI